MFENMSWRLVTIALDREAAVDFLCFVKRSLDLRRSQCKVNCEQRTRWYDWLQPLELTWQSSQVEGPRSLDLSSSVIHAMKGSEVDNVTCRPFDLVMVVEGQHRGLVWREMKQIWQSLTLKWERSLMGGGSISWPFIQALWSGKWKPDHTSYLETHLRNPRLNVWFHPSQMASSEWEHQQGLQSRISFNCWSKFVAKILSL